MDQAEINDNREKRASIHARRSEEQISGHTNETMHRKITSGARRPFLKKRAEEGLRLVDESREDGKEEGLACRDVSRGEKRGNRTTGGAARSASSIK